MKNFLKILSFSILTAFAVASCEEIKEPVEIHLNKEYISNLQVGASQTLVATVTPEGSNVKVVWTSADTGIATVSSEGVVTGVAPGTVDITAKADNSTATCKVVVTPALPTNIELSESEIELNIGDKRNLEVTLTPSYAVAEDLVWESSDSEVAVVSDGVVTAVKEGEAVITVACNDGKLTASCSVKVLPEDVEVEVKVTAIEIDPKSVELEIGQQKTLAVNVTPAEAVADDLVWETSNSEVAIVSGGVVTAVKAGNATITAKCNDGAVSATCSVTVLETEVAPSLTSVVINADATDLQIGKTVALRAEYFPEGAVPTNVSWTVDKPELAQINQDGSILGLYAEKQPIDPANPAYTEWVKVTVTIIADGLTASYSLRVIPTQPESIEIDLPAEGFIRVGQEWSFNPRVMPEGLGFSVYCTASLPSGKPQNNAYGVFVSDVAGTINGIFAVSNHENLVYEGLRKSVTLDVLPYYVQTIALPETKNVEVGGSFILTPEFTSDVEGFEPTHKDVKWTSSDESKAIVDSYGKVTALAPGSVVITATTSNGFSVPSGQAQKSASCTLNITEAILSINVGDYYYSDGTWSSTLDASKTVIGIVFAKANTASSDALLAKDYPGCEHGLVLSIDEYEQPCVTGRLWLRADLITWMAQNGYNQWSVDDKYCGYNNTQGLLAINAANVASGTGVIHVEHVEAVLEHRNKVQSPEGASAWYMPSYLEMKELSANLDVVNASLENVGGTTLRRTYEYVYERQTGGTPIPTVGVAEQHYYYSNNITENTIYAYNMKTDKLVNPKVATSPWDSVSGEQTKLPVRVILAF